MDTTGWLILGTFLGPVLGALAATALISALLRLARARAQRVKYVPVSGTDLYANGVPLTESQFRELWAAYQAALEVLPPPAERKEPDWERQYEAARRFSVLTGTFPRSFPNIADVDEAWKWYAAYNGYAIEAQVDSLRTVEPLWGG